MAQDVIPKTLIAKTRMSVNNRSQCDALLGREFAVLFMVFLQLVGDASDPLLGLVVIDGAIDGDLLQGIRGVLVVLDQFLIVVVCLLQHLRIGNGDSTLPPLVAEPQSGDERQECDRYDGAPAEHQHTALPGQPAAR